MMHAVVAGKQPLHIRQYICVFYRLHVFLLNDMCCSICKKISRKWNRMEMCVLGYTNITAIRG